MLFQFFLSVLSPKTPIIQNKDISPIYSEETNQLENTPLSEENSLSYQQPVPSIQSNLVSNTILNTYNTWKADLIPPTPEKKISSLDLSNKHTEHIKLAPNNSEQSINRPNQLEIQFMPYLSYPTSTKKYLTNSDTCSLKKKTLAL